MEDHGRLTLRFPGVVMAVAALSCTTVTLSPAPSPPSSSATVEAFCEPTLAFMTPPMEALEFFARGSTQPDRAREALRAANWYGNQAMWVILPPAGEIVGRLDDKIPPYRMKRGFVEWVARRLDGPGTVARRPIGPPGYGDIGFVAGGPAFPTAGCWEVTYTLDGHDSLPFVLRVR